MLNSQPSYSYVYQEYPKALYHPDGKSKRPVIVKDAAEEAAQIKVWMPDPIPVPEPEPVVEPLVAPVAAAPAITEPLATVPPAVAEPTRDAMVAKAEALGLKVDGRWSDKRLADEIAAAI